MKFNDKKSRNERHKEDKKDGNHKLVNQKNKIRHDINMDRNNYEVAVDKYEVLDLLDCNKIKYLEPSERTIMKMSRKKRDKKGDKDSDEK